MNNRLATTKPGFILDLFPSTARIHLQLDNVVECKYSHHHQSVSTSCTRTMLFRPRSLAQSHQNTLRCSEGRNAPTPVASCVEDEEVLASQSKAVANVQ